MSGESAETGLKSTRFSRAEAIAAFRSGAPPESADFDFLIGDWIVRGERYGADGSPEFEYDGQWHAEHLCDRRMVLDHFTAEVDGGGPFAFLATLRTWCPFSDQWEMTFLTAMQPQPQGSFTGRRVGDEMHLTATRRGADGGPVESRVRFHAITPTSFSWEQTTSRDGGKSWQLEARIHSQRRGDSAKTSADLAL